MTMVQTNIRAKPLTGRKVLLWLVGFFGVIFAANGVFIYLAIGSFPGVVVESSYEAGQTYNREIAAAKVQEQLNWQVSSEFVRSGDGGGKLIVGAADTEGVPLHGVEIHALLRNPVHEGADVEVAFTAVGGGRYTGEVENITAGNWTLVLDITRDGERKFRSENRIFLKD